jgi:transcriptional regulator with XRE-family HTH domain
MHDAQTTRKRELSIRGASHSVAFAMALERAEFVRRLREARKQAGLTQSQLAQKVGVELKTYNRWEALNNGTEPRGGNLERLTAALGITRDYLLGPAPGRVGQDERLAHIEAKLDENNTLLRALLAHHGVTVDTLIEPPIELVAALDQPKRKRTQTRRRV